MTDAPLDPSRFVDDDALVFEDADADAAPVPDALTAKPRRAPRKGVAAAVAPAAEAAVAPEPVPAPSVAAEPVIAPIADATVPAPSALRRYALPAIVGFSMLSSFASFGGLIAVGRTLAELRAEQADVAADKEMLARVPAAIARLDRASATLAANAARPPATGALTADDLRHALDELRLALAARQPQGVAALADQSRSSFSEVATRLDRIEAAVRRPASASSRSPR